MVENIHKINECPDCADPDVVYNERKQQVVCKACGLIYEPLTPKDEETYLGLGKEVNSKSAKKAKRR